LAQISAIKDTTTTTRFPLETERLLGKTQQIVMKQESICKEKPLYSLRMLCNSLAFGYRQVKQLQRLFHNNAKKS
jgi:hypothetical protein